MNPTEPTDRMTPEVQRELDALASVQLHHVTRRFDGAVVALDDVNVAFRTGETTVLLGLSGSGKSTLLRHINGMQQPSQGNVRVLGEDLSALKTRELQVLRRDIAVIFQHFNLVGPMSVLENVCTGRLGSLRGPRLGLLMYPRSVREEGLAHLERVGLADQAHQRADTLSGGQQQRVAIARALMQNPRVLLADEPVASLDPVSSLQVMNLISEIAEERNLTVIASLHQVQLAIDVADRIIGLQSGKVVFDRGTADLTEGDAASIYQSVAAPQRVEQVAEVGSGAGHP